MCKSVEKGGKADQWARCHPCVVIARSEAEYPNLELRNVFIGSQVL
jgi:hypothetical protein